MNKKEKIIFVSEGIIGIFFLLVIMINSFKIKKSEQFIEKELFVIANEKFVEDSTKLVDSIKVADSIAHAKEIKDSITEANRHLLFMAICKVESNFNLTAKNRGCVGPAQISMAMLNEANKIVGFKMFESNDRYSLEDSYCIFKIIMNKYNPNYDAKEACKLWNPTAGSWYYQKVMKAYHELKKLKIVAF